MYGDPYISPVICFKLGAIFNTWGRESSKKYFYWKLK